MTDLQKLAQSSDFKSFSEQTKTVDWWARSLSIGALLLSAAGIYFSNFYLPEHLLVSAKIDPLGFLNASEGGTLTLVLTNLGKSSVPIDRVLLIYIYGPKTNLNADTKQAVEMTMDSPNFKPGAEFDIADGEKAVALNPQNTRLNNKALSTTSSLIEQGKSALVSFKFRPYVLDTSFNVKRLLIATAIHCFDKTGTSHWKILVLGGARNYMPGFDDVFDGALSGVKLLPANSITVFPNVELPDWFEKEPDYSHLFKRDK